MAYLKPQSPIKLGENHVYPLTTVDQVVMSDGKRLSGVGVYLEKPNEYEDTTLEAGVNADTLGGILPSGYMIKNEYSVAEIDLEGSSGAVTPTMANADLLAGMTYQQIVNLIYPIGRTITTLVDSDDPNTLYPWQVWERTAKGRMFIGADETYALGSIGGEAEHTLTVDEVPEHNHETSDEHMGFLINSDTGSTHAVISSIGIYPLNTGYTGGNQPHNNMPPYLAVNMWKRIS